MTSADARAPRSPLDRFAFPALDRRSADYFVDALCFARNARERVWCHLLAWLPGGLRVGLLRERGHRRPRGWPVAMPTAATETWLAALMREGGPARAVAGAQGGRILMALTGRRTAAGTVAFLFSARERDPVGVLKVRPSGAHGAGVRREARALRVLHRVLPARLATTVPQVLACRQAHGQDLLLLTSLPGRPAYVDLHRDLMPRKRMADHFRHAAVWLSDFHLATRRTPRPVDGKEWDQGIARALALPHLSRDGDALAWASQLRDRRARAAVVPVACHGDFWARNVLLPTSRSASRGDPQVGVVDWESFKPRALPSEDLFHFPLTYGLAFPWTRYRRADAQTAFRRTFLEDNEVSREVARYLRTYCQRTALDAELLTPLFRLFLLTRASSHAATAGDGTPWVEFDRLLAASRQSVFVDASRGVA